MPDEENNEIGTQEYARSRGFMPGSPDPTRLTTDAVRQSVEVSRREIGALSNVIKTRFDGIDHDQKLVWDRLRELPEMYELATGHLREEVIALAAHNREVLTQRLNDLDTASKLAAERIERIPHDNATDAAAAAADVHDSMRAEREYIMSLITGLREVTDQRLSAMDIATKLLAASVDKFPTDVDRAVASGREVLQGEINRVQGITTEKFQAIDGTFSSNALALTAALAAQKEAAAEQNKSNTLAITKSESSTKETIAANATQAQTGLLSLENQFDDLKERLVRIESLGVGIQQANTEARAEHVENRMSQGAMVGLVVVFVSVIGLIITLVTVFHKLQRATACVRGGDDVPATVVPCLMM